MQEGYYILAQGGGGGDLFSMIWPFALIILVFWLLFIRPQRKKQQQEQQMQSTLQPGVEVLTKAGFYGTVVEVRENDVELEISPGTRVRMVKQGIGDVISPKDDIPDDTPVEDRPDFPGDDRNDGPR